MIWTMDSILRYAREKQKDIIAMTREFVECESPSDDPAAVNRFVQLVADTASPWGRVKTLPGGRFGRILLCTMDLPGRKKNGNILALGHSDTVWPVAQASITPRMASPVGAR